MKAWLTKTVNFWQSCPPEGWNESDVEQLQRDVREAQQLALECKLPGVFEALNHPQPIIALLRALEAMPEPEFLTVEQAAERLQVSKDSVYDLIKQGLLKHTRVGTAIRIKPTDLDHIQQDDGW